MQNGKWILYGLLSFYVNDSFSQYPKTPIEECQVIHIKSAVNQQDYTLYIKLPSFYKDSANKRYPVMYFLDAQWAFNPALEIRRSLLYDNLMSDPIFVGIAFQGNPFINRNRDFTPTGKDSTSGGAPKFLKVIRTEIMTTIDSVYRTDKINNGIQGASSGGLFVLYTLLSQPDLFNRYIANSPALYYDDGVIFKMEKSFAAKNHRLPVKLFMTIGSYELENNSRPWFMNFTDQVNASNYEGLQMETLVIDKMGHLGQSFYAVGRGLEFIYNLPDVAVDTLLLNQYSGKYEQGVMMIRIDNTLYMDMGSKKKRLYAENSERFYVPGENGTAEFLKNDKGNVTAIRFASAEGDFISKKISK